MGLDNEEVNEGVSFHARPFMVLRLVERQQLNAQTEHVEGFSIAVAL